jgi:hypothetical protein
MRSSALAYGSFRAGSDTLCPERRPDDRPACLGPPIAPPSRRMWCRRIFPAHRQRTRIRRTCIARRTDIEHRTFSSCDYAIAADRRKQARGQDHEKNTGSIAAARHISITTAGTCAFFEALRRLSDQSRSMARWSDACETFGRGPGVIGLVSSRFGRMIKRASRRQEHRRAHRSSG